MTPNGTLGATPKASKKRPDVRPLGPVGHVWLSLSDAASLLSKSEAEVSLLIIDGPLVATYFSGVLAVSEGSLRKLRGDSPWKKRRKK